MYTRSNRRAHNYEYSVPSKLRNGITSFNFNRRLYDDTVSCRYGCISRSDRFWSPFAQQLGHRFGVISRVQLFQSIETYISDRRSVEHKIASQSQYASQHILLDVAYWMDMTTNPTRSGSAASLVTRRMTSPSTAGISDRKRIKSLSFASRNGSIPSSTLYNQFS